MKKLLSIAVLLILVVSATACGETIEVDNNLPVTEQIFESISFDRPIDWAVSTEEGESNSILIKSNSTYHNHSVIVVSLIKDINMSASEYAKSVSEGLENTSEPKDMEFGELVFPMVEITQNTKTFNFFYGVGSDVYSFTYANMENRIEKELKDILASLKSNQITQP